MLTGSHPFSHRVSQWLGRTLPTSCVLCGTSAKEALCARCQSQHFSAPLVRCHQCAITLPHSHANDQPTCGSCLSQPPMFDATFVACDYIAPVDQLVLALKFGGQLALAPLMGNILYSAYQQLHAHTNPPSAALPDLIVAVPLGNQRLIERGFNQSHEIARTLASAMGIKLATRLILRTRDTAAQATLPPKDRRKNIRNAFTLTPEAVECVRDRHVAIVDDVMTTGETLNELAATLKRFGVARVTNLVFARSPH